MALPLKIGKGVMEYWSIVEDPAFFGGGVLVLSSKIIYVKKYLMEFLRFYHLFFPLLHHSRTPENG